MDFNEIEQVILPKVLVDETQLFLREVGATGREGMVLWVGHAEEKLFRITNNMIPRQRGVKTKDGVCVIVDADEMHRINVELFRAGLRLIAQVHSHPTEAYHSETDDEYAIATTTGCLSLVIPDFAARDFDLEDCAVYRLNRNGDWQQVSPDRVKSLIAIEVV